MEVKNYQFGKVEVGGKLYHHDIIVCEDRISSWWRVTGHKVVIEDIKEMVNKEKPEVLIFGTGAHGLMEVTPEVREFLKKKEIEVKIAKTSEAIAQFTQQSKNKKVALAIHLTC
jgi:hypothetical protein